MEEEQFHWPSIKGFLFYGHMVLPKTLKPTKVIFLAKVNHVDRKHFDKNLENISPCHPSGTSFVPLENYFYFLKLHPTHGFI